MNQDFEEFVCFLKLAEEKAKKNKENVYLTDDEEGHWFEFGDGSDGDAPGILLAVTPQGKFKLIDNTADNCTGEKWRQ